MTDERCPSCGAPLRQTDRTVGEHVTSITEACSAGDCTWRRVRTVNEQARLGEVGDAR